MLRWWIVIVAVGVYAIVLSCAIWPNSTTVQGQTADAKPAAPAADVTIQSREGLPICSVSIPIQRMDWMDKYKQCIDEIAGLGADTVMLVVDARQETIKSTHVFLDLRMTPSPEALSDLIKHAKSKKLRVMLMPIVLLDNPINDDWRGKFDPQTEYGGWDEWFKSYRAMLYQFSWIAEANGVDVFVVGSELISTERHVDQWIKTIDEVRKTYHGRLTYSSNWDHFRQVGFWDHLDMIGMNSYWKFGEKGSNEDPSIDYIKKRWTEIQSDLIPWVERQGKPLLFIEIGWFSQKNVAYEPWDYTQDQPVAIELQRKLYQAFFESWWGKPMLGGFNVWEWTPGDGGAKDTGYTPENKPAEKVIRDWLAKPRWTVK